MRQYGGGDNPAAFLSPVRFNQQTRIRNRIEVHEVKQDKSWTRAATTATASLLLAAAAAVHAEDSAPVNPFAGNAEVAAEGGSLFNQYCSHCHGQWADQGERPRDLRRLKLRYGDDAIAMYVKTLDEGRVDKGMPVWKGVLPDETIWKIYTFLMTVQSEE